MKRPSGAAPSAPDLDLWQEIKSVLPTTRQRLPFLCGDIRGFKVILVDGGQVMLRQRKGGKTPHGNQGDFMDFVSGGNHYEDPELCAKDEVYIDGLVDPSQWPFVCYHEIHEATLMRDRGWSYDKAHESANRDEKALRQSSDGTH